MHTKRYESCVQCGALYATASVYKLFTQCLALLHGTLPCLMQCSVYTRVFVWLTIFINPHPRASLYVTACVHVHIVYKLFTQCLALLQDTLANAVQCIHNVTCMFCVACLPEEVGHASFLVRESPIAAIARLHRP